MSVFLIFAALSNSAIKKDFICTLSACIQLRITKGLSRKVMNFRHLLGCDTIGIVARNFKAFSGVLSFQVFNIF